MSKINDNNKKDREVTLQGFCGPVRECCIDHPECLKFYTSVNGEEYSFCGCPY
ncbi:hypothetical protein EDD68_11196 [Melghiribacillus thermohalophilus]|uniref:Uncharacterized protein n=1 Tax=Melghiribacillus thermohalophilus TaxID=1324956 RepID=A0A4R3MXR8_9BACI|nr:hypothetical protein EDD68_11196 [Melghiribacillus thermohalophilus]